MIELSNVTVRFAAGVEAVKDVSLNIARGEVFGIVGTSGAGKSTLVRLINLLQRPTSGAVRIDGVDISRFEGEELRAVRRRIGMVFQDANLLASRSAFDNVALPLRIAGRPRPEIDARVPELLKLVGLEEKARFFPAQLSGGQRQRVGIARALATSPDILLCDEPTSALDVETTASILALLADLHRKLAITMVVITHEMAVVKAICDRVAVMKDGHVVEQGPVYELFAAPKHPFSQALVARTLDLRLPEKLLDGTRGRIVKIVFRGQESLLSDVSRECDVRIHLLLGNVEYIGGHPVGTLVAGIEGDQPRVERAMKYIEERAEVVRG
ncbi:MAG TPA: ATP-binding cassette domain-containing protein [Myxococcales bacterium]|nr:ATP-binding cassette domain-containing protein [Myxococcales bacterium]